MEKRLFIGYAGSKRVYAEIKLTYHSIAIQGFEKNKYHCKLCKGFKTVFEYQVQGENEKGYTMAKEHTRKLIEHRHGKRVTFTPGKVRCPTCGGSGWDNQSLKFSAETLKPIFDGYWELYLLYEHRGHGAGTIDGIMESMTDIQLTKDQIKQFRYLEQFKGIHSVAGSNLQEEVFKLVKDREWIKLINGDVVYVDKNIYTKHSKITDENPNTSYRFKNHVLKRHCILKDDWYEYGTLWLVNDMPEKAVQTAEILIAELDNRIPESPIMAWFKQQGITFETRKIDKRPDNNLNDMPNHWEIKLLDKAEKKEYTIYFSQGDGIPEMTPLDRIMLTYAEDCSRVEFETFEEWCNSLGFDNDSIKAKQIFDGLDDIRDNLERMFDLPEFLERFVYENYDEAENE